MTYLPGENCYFVTTYKNFPSLSPRDSTSNLLYSAIVVGDENGFEDHIELNIYERFLKCAQGQYEWVITPCLDYRDDKIIGGKRDFQILCDFPHFKENKDNDQMKQLGFEVERHGGDDFYEDSFGENHSIPTKVKYKKNGVEIRYVY